MTALLLSLVLTASPEDARLEPRLHTAIGPVVTYGRSDWSIGYGLGISGDLGVVLQDLLIVTSRLTWGTTMQRDAGTIGLSVDVIVGEHWSFGGGPAFGFIGSLMVADFARALSFAFPLRVQFGLLSAHSGRSAEEGSHGVRRLRARRCARWRHGRRDTHCSAEPDDQPLQLERCGGRRLVVAVSTPRTEWATPETWSFPAGSCFAPTPSRPTRR